jgi:hypothetical protein
VFVSLLHLIMSFTGSDVRASSASPDQQNRCGVPVAAFG